VSERAVREAAWAILRDRKGMVADGHRAAVEWASAYVDADRAQPLGHLVTLSPEDQAIADAEGRARFGRNRHKLRDKLGDRGRAMGVEPDLIGAGAELAVARWRGVEWDEARIKRPGRRADVDGINVRARRLRSDGRLPVRDYDPAGQPVLLVLVDAPRYWLAGWIMPRDARRDEWLADPGGYGLVAHFVPRSSLRPIAELP
jgi:hypothetical protein